MPLEPQAKKGAWLKNPNQTKTYQSLPRAVLHLHSAFKIQSRDQSTSSGPEKKSGHTTLAGYDILDTKELIKMSQVCMHKIEEFK